MVVISIQTTNLLGFLGALQLSAHKAELRTVVGLNAQPTVGPELPLAAEPVRGLHQCDQAGGSNRTDAGYLPQQFRGFMFPALGQKLGSDVSPQGLQSVQLLIEQLRAAGARRLAESCSTIPLESAPHKPGCRHKECPNRDTAPSVDSSLASNLC